MAALGLQNLRPFCELSCRAANGTLLFPFPGRWLIPSIAVVVGHATSSAVAIHELCRGVSDLENAFARIEEVGLRTPDSSWRESLRRVDVARSQDFLDRVNLVLVHGVSHARIDPLVDVRVHPAEHVSRFVNPFERDVWVDIAAPEEHRRAAEGTGVIPRRPGRCEK